MQNISSTSSSCKGLSKVLVFVDSSVENYDSLVAGVKSGTEVVLLNPNQDGVAQITAELAKRTNIASLHIVSHGSPGNLYLGCTTLNLTTLRQYRDQLQQWRHALAKDADILLYGCHVAAELKGAAFIKCFQSLVGSNIAASTTLTGSAAQGGDWNLAAQIGKIKSSLAFQPSTIQAYASVLAQLFLNEDFSSASGSLPPLGWMTEVISGNAETDRWVFDNPASRPIADLLTGPFAIYDSDFFSNDNLAENVAFTSPTFDTSGASTLFLQFDQEYQGLVDPDYGSKAFVEIYDGATWQPVYVSEADEPVIGPQIIDISQFANIPDAQVRFRYEGNWSYHWAVDNVRVTDELIPGVRTFGTPGVSEDNVPDPLSLQFVLNTQPTEDVTINFGVDETQLQAIAPLTFTLENWNIPQTTVVAAVSDDIDEGNEQTSPIQVTVTSKDVIYEGVAIDNVIAEITENVIPGYTSYRTVEGTFRDLSDLATANPNIASWLDIGDTYNKIASGGSEGYDIFALELTNKDFGVAAEKPTLYVQGSIHAREYTTAELATRFAEELVSGYGTDADSTWLLDYFRVNIVPIVNPDGRKFAEQGYSWRKNTNPGDESAPFPLYGVDLNRNYASKWGEIPGGSSGDPSSLVYRGTAPFSEPESKSVSEYVASLFPDQKGPNDFDPAPNDATGVYLDLHSYGNLVLYPFGWTTEPAPNKKELETLGRKFGYYTGVDGAAYDVAQAIGLYPTDGTTDDWAYNTLGVASYTIELGTQFFEESEYFENTIVPEFTPALFYAAKSAYRPYQTPAGPESLEVMFDLDNMILSAIADDTRYDDGATDPRDSEAEPTQSIAAARYSINQPSWIPDVELFPLFAADGAFDGEVESLATVLDLASLSPGRNTIFVESQDAAGNWGVPTALFITVPEPSMIIGLSTVAALSAVSFMKKKRKKFVLSIPAESIPAE